MDDPPDTLDRGPARRRLANEAPVTATGVSASHRRPATLRGRRAECQMIDELLASARDGHGQVLVVRGDAGTGKTALLNHISERASGCRLARVTGVEAEMELPFAGLQHLCASMLHHIDRLPAPQRDALASAVGIAAARTPDRFLVGLGVLSLLAQEADEEPLICVIDDAQWLDDASAQTLSFVARRLRAEPIAMFFAARTSVHEVQLGGLPELVLTGLSDVDARAVLDSAPFGPLDPAVRDALVAETRGNPLALLELSWELTPAELAGGFGLPHALPVSVRLEDTFRRRLADLPADTRQLVLVAAADPLGDPGLLWRACEGLRLRRTAADAATASGLIEIGARVRFCDPRVRAAVYGIASEADRRRAHWALAEATVPQTDPDRRAWHRAWAVLGTDESVAEELEESAQSAFARGGTAAAAAFLRRAMELTPEPARRGRRALAAAHATLQAGDPESARQLLVGAERCPLGEIEQAKRERLRAELAFTLSRGTDAPPLLLEAAKRLERLDVGLARETYLEALWAVQFAGRLAVGASVRGVAEAARAAPRPVGPPRASDFLLDGLALRITAGCAAGAPLLQRALREFRGPDVSPDQSLRWLFLASTAALDLWDDDAWEALASRHVRLARDTGALAGLPGALTLRIAMHVFAGELVAAASLVDEVKTVVDAIGTGIAPYGELLYAAWNGREAEAAELIAVTEKEVLARGEGLGLSVTEWASALVATAAGRYEDALTLGQRAGQHPEELGISTWALVEVVEAAARLGRFECASDALSRLSKSTQAAGTEWAVGVEARSRALLSSPERAEDLYRKSIERLGRSRIRPELARSHLVYGEWLRGTNRCAEAREHLRTAHEMFTAMGIEGFGERARRELRAMGEKIRSRTVESRIALTPQEAEIARLAAEMRTNPEIGTQLFLSPRTVEWHLRKVFTKLGVKSRRELLGALR